MGWIFLSSLERRDEIRKDVWFSSGLNDGDGGGSRSRIRSGNRKMTNWTKVLDFLGRGIGNSIAMGQLQ